MLRLTDLRPGDVLSYRGEITGPLYNAAGELTTVLRSGTVFFSTRATPLGFLPDFRLVSRVARSTGPAICPDQLNKGDVLILNPSRDRSFSTLEEGFYTFVSIFHDSVFVVRGPCGESEGLNIDVPRFSGFFLLVSHHPAGLTLLPLGWEFEQATRCPRTGSYHVGIGNCGHADDYRTVEADAPFFAQALKSAAERAWSSIDYDQILKAARPVIL